MKVSNDCFSPPELIYLKSLVSGDYSHCFLLHPRQAEVHLSAPSDHNASQVDSLRPNMKLTSCWLKQELTIDPIWFFVRDHKILPQQFKVLRLDPRKERAQTSLCKQKMNSSV